MSSFPIALQLEGQRAVVVGGGNVASRKISSLLEAGARVRVISPQICPAIQVLAAQSAIEYFEHPFSPSEIRDAFIVITATSDESTNAAVVETAKNAGILVSDATVPQRGDFTVPAVHRIGTLTFTIDTDGSAPAFAKRLRDELAVAFGSDYAAAGEVMAFAREYVNATVPFHDRASIMNELAGLPLGTLGALSRSAAEREVDRLAQRHRQDRRLH